MGPKLPFQFFFFQLGQIPQSFLLKMRKAHGSKVAIPVFFFQLGLVYRTAAGFAGPTGRGGRLGRTLWVTCGRRAGSLHKWMCLPLICPATGIDPITARLLQYSEYGYISANSRPKTHGHLHKHAWKSMEQPPAERICEARRKFARNICLLRQEEMAQLHNL